MYILRAPISCGDRCAFWRRGDARAYVDLGDTPPLKGQGTPSPNRLRLWRAEGRLGQCSLRCALPWSTVRGSAAYGRKGRAPIMGTSQALIKGGIARAEATAECGLTSFAPLGSLENDWRTVAPSEGLSIFLANNSQMFLCLADRNLCWR